MAEEIKDLIAKIQQEGVDEAFLQAAKIKAEADATALKIIAAAKGEAQKIMEQANSQAKTTQVATQAALKQSGRDLLIGLKQEIMRMLERLVKLDLHKALTAEELAGIIGGLIKNAPLDLGSQVIVSLNKADKDKLEQGFLKKLVAETKKSIVLNSADGLGSGFVISFDSGKSIFDFSGQALSDYLCKGLRPELNKILDSK